MAAPDDRPSQATMATLVRELDGLLVDTEPARLYGASRDHHWLSPVLAEELSEVRADAVVSPASVDELKRVVAACVRHRVPLTVRGGGGGTAGQAMPLANGVVVDTRYLNRVLAIAPGWTRVEAGCPLDVLDAALHERGQALRVHPSAWSTTTAGGFVATGFAGVGSVQWGSLDELGAVRAVRLLTMEANPRLLELRAAHLPLVVRAWGTTGIVTEVELPTAPATPWFERVVAFDERDAALDFADRIAHADALVKRLVSVVAAPAPGRYLFAHGGVDEATHVVLVTAAEAGREAFDAVVAEHGGECLAVASSPLFELAWHHTTRHALKHDRALTALEVRVPGPDHRAGVAAVDRAFDREEVTGHWEFVRLGGRVGCVGLPLVRFTTRERLAAIRTTFARAGVEVVDPHATTLSGTGARAVDRTLATFKREIDPYGLLNPRKLGTPNAPPNL